jgi:DNA-binding transcriptional ArsR family regulator
MEDIQEIKVNQSIVGRQLKYGDLVITAPTIDAAIVIKNLDSVWRLYKILNDYARDQENEGFVITT